MPVCMYMYHVCSWLCVEVRRGNWVPETGVIGGCDQPYVGDGPSAIAASVFNC